MTSTVTPTTPDGLDVVAARRRIVPFGAGLAAAGLLIGAGGNTAQAVLGQIIDRPEDVAGQIALAQEQGGLMAVAALSGTLAVPFMAIGFIAAAHLLARSARRLGHVSGLLLVLGMFGFMAVQTGEMIQLAAMLDPAGAEAATFLHGMHTLPLLSVFGLPFMVGTPLGMLLLNVTMLVKGAGVPRWIPATWLVFVVLDFTVGGVGPVDPHWLYLAGAVGLAHHVLVRRAWDRA